ncbi:MAG: hypothetical protein SCJ94_08800 [Bacillota bacterium]|nr:hypothetical protein [Bacillota bacterium]MDW7730086.1 hypothetical protein [Bacillota bacterium]
MKKIYLVLTVMHLFVGVGALFGGMAAMLDPWEPAGVPVEMLEGSPFTNYFIPGLILFTVIGLGHIFSAVTAIRKFEYQGYISSVFSWGLMIWIVVQCIMINAVALLHVIFFLIGLVGAVLAWIILYKQNAFPANLLRR